MTTSSNLTKSRKALLGMVAVVTLIGMGGIAYHISDADAKTPIEAAAPIVSVNVQTVNPQNIRLWSSFSGRMQAVDYAEIRPEVSGRITAIRFKDGQTVQAGDVLLVIDPQPYEAALAKAEADLSSARTKAIFAKKEFDRAINLIKTNDVPQRLYDERENNDRVAQADIKVAEAGVKQARIDLDHAYVKAPITGRVSRAELTVGNLVQTGPSAPILTSIVSNDGIYADFEVDEQTYMKSIRSHASTSDAEQAIPVELTVQKDEGHTYTGTIYSFDNRIDTSSGTIRARARFDNKDGSLVPGMFVSVKLGGGSNEAAIVIPERAVGNDQSKKYVYVVSNENKVAYREITLGQQAGKDQRIVLSGLQAGERIIVDGVQHVQPGSIVQAREAALPDKSVDKMASN